MLFEIFMIALAVICMIAGAYFGRAKRVKCSKCGATEDIETYYKLGSITELDIINGSINPKLTPVDLCKRCKVLEERE